MRFHEIQNIREGFFSGLITAVQDRLLLRIRGGETEIPTEDLRQELANDGYNISINQLIQAVDSSNFATSVNRDKIIPKGELPQELQAAGPESSEEKVDDLASREAKKSLK